MAEARDLENLLRLQAQAMQLFSIMDMPISPADRSTEIQRLGEDIEQRAKQLVSRVRELRGLGDDRPSLTLVSQEPATPPPPVSINAKLRDALMRFRGGFTEAELATELDVTVPVLRKLLKPLIVSEVVRDTGTKFSGKKVFEYVKPESPAEVGPTARPTRTPPERDRPAYTEARATGMPVRITTERSDRRGRSTPGQRQKIINRDRNYSKMQAAVEERMRKQRESGQKEPKWKRKRK